MRALGRYLQLLPRQNQDVQGYPPPGPCDMCINRAAPSTALGDQSSSDMDLSWNEGSNTVTLLVSLEKANYGATTGHIAFHPGSARLTSKKPPEPLVSLHLTVREDVRMLPHQVARCQLHLFPLGLIQGSSHRLPRLTSIHIANLSERFGNFGTPFPWSVTVNGEFVQSWYCNSETLNVQGFEVDLFVMVTIVLTAQCLTAQPVLH
ncbi:hypothetical protein CALCODRAFT_211626 [Calocera cornea HHB12733]|uniref:Uncharacterized protein n=1 Tax=Calocera cornea HHB12733 TaxID=1353952 RepID=A0A165C2I2_9BASI|nr:hypothetical protein CALCODRAFT_211626 [Calocera cornea HHB12733]